MRKSLVKLLAIPSGQSTPTIWQVMQKLLWVVAGLTLTTSIYAVGMGGIKVASALGQPLNAEIGLVVASKAEKDGLSARLASPEAYKNAGLEYPSGNKFKFQIESRANGDPYITVSSSLPVNEPFVSLLVELSWSSGRLAREYTFLLDPVDYTPLQPSQGPVETVSPAVRAEAPSSTTGSTEATVSPLEPATQVTAVTIGDQAAQDGTTNPRERVVPVESASVETVPVEVAPVKSSPAKTARAMPDDADVPPPIREWITVHRGDTMYKIAEKTKLAHMDIDRMLVALYRVNANQFDGRNMNRIKTGKVLQLPDENEYESVSLPEARREIRAQAADWNAYRQKLASAAPISNQTQSIQQVATGKISSSVADKAPVAKESAKEVLKLSRSEVAGDVSAAGAGGKSMSAQDRKNAEREDAIAKAKAEQDEKMRVAQLEKDLQEMKRLLQLKTEAAAVVQPKAQAPAAAPQAPAVTPPPAPAKAPEANAAKPKPAEVKEEPGLLDQLLNEPLYLGGGVLVLLVLGGAGFLLHRRKKKHLEEFRTGHISEPVASTPDEGDFTSIAGPAVAASEHVDPISEADLFLNFGRDVQAEEILKEALESTPGNHQIHLKLLGIYVNRKDTNSFAAIARKLQDSGDQDAWQQALEMGRKLEPNNPMYGGSGDSTSTADAEHATAQVQAFTPESHSPAQPEEAFVASELDFDFDAAAKAAPPPSPEVNLLGDAEIPMMLPDTALGSSMDFDITAQPSAPAQGESAASPVADMMFDITGGQSLTPQEQPQTSQPDDGGMAFTLDFPVGEAAAKPVATAAPAPASDGLAFGGINLNFDETPMAPLETATGDKSSQWQEVATKLDLARAYQEMGDGEGAREILNEVLNEGDAEQQAAAKALFAQLG